MDHHIQAYLLGAAGRARSTERVGPFTATFAHGSDNPFLNYAVPDQGATPSPTDVAALVSAYRRRNLTPRLEYLPGIAPHVEAALVAGGFTCEGRYPIMVYDSATGNDIPAPPGIQLAVPVSDDDLLAVLTVQNEAYGDPPPSMAQATARRGLLAKGGLLILARDGATGEPAGAGLCDVPANSTTELAAIAVSASFRRRGIAGAMISRLARDASARGIETVFLMATHPTEEHIAERAGFKATSEILHISFPVA